MRIPINVVNLIFASALLSAGSYAYSNPQMVQYETWIKDQQYKNIINSINKLDLKSLSPQHYTMFITANLKVDLDDAEDAATQAIEAYPNNPDMYLIHASVMGEQAQGSIFSALSYAQKALNSLKRATELAPTIPKYRLGLMSFYLAAPSIAGGDNDLALEQAMIIAQLDERKGLIALSRYHYSVDENAKAFSIIKNGIQKFVDDPMLYNQLAGLHTREEQYQEAIDTYIKLTTFAVPDLLEDDLHNNDKVDEYDNAQYRQLNSHYQIARLALESKSNMDLGIKHISIYLNMLNTADFDTSSLPSKEWAKLRLAGLQFASKQLDEAKSILSKVDLDDDDDHMVSVYKKLNKQIKKALKKR